MSKVDEIKKWIKQIEARIEREEIARPGYTSAGRLDLFIADEELTFYTKYEKSAK